ncbi:MAG: efflux RND transporter periplasmic adaptor subunit [Bacteroidetes bacterium]|nr:MAG: efflux RND transporter periplasmic adaptor subunit [Bacteroidota bacterium]
MTLRTPSAYLLSLSLLLGATLSFPACRKPKTRVQTGQSEIRDIYSRVSESGVIQPTIEVPVAPDVSGEVVFIAIMEGDKVKKGDLLLTIRPDDYRAQLEQADAALSRSKAAYLQAQASEAQAEATLLQDSVSMERTRALFRDKVVSQVDQENAELRYKVSRSQWEAAKYNVQSAFYQVESAEATRKQARQNLDRTNIYASMDGTITLLNVEVGQRVVGTSMMSGTEILKIADLSSMEVVVEVNENDIINVSLDDSARIEVDAFPGEVFYGKVTEIAYSAQVAGLSVTDQVTNFEVKVKVSPASYEKLDSGPKRRAGESPFRPGMTALVEIYTRQEKNAIAVPIQAVTLREQAEGEDPQEVVFRLGDGQVEQVPVRTGISDDTHIQILEGLEAGQTVVTGPYTTLTRELKDAMPVVVDEGREGRRRP